MNDEMLGEIPHLWSGLAHFGVSSSIVSIA
jgi:hypothetical protein